MRKWPEPQAARQCHEIAGLEPAQTDLSDAGIAAEEARPTGIGRSAGPRRNDRQDPVGPEPSESEQHSASGWSVNPLQVVDCEDDDLTCGLESIEQFQQRDPHSHRVRRWLRRRSCLHLVDDTVRKEHFLLVPTDLDNDSTGEGYEELRKQARLA